MLLGSPPDMVHMLPLRETGSSTPLAAVRRHIALPGVGIRPCCSGLQVQGTAGSPASAALPKAVVDIVLQFLSFINRIKKLTIYISEIYAIIFSARECRDMGA